MRSARLWLLISSVVLQQTLCWEIRRHDRGDKLVAIKHFA